jgi:pimeloyl-ACP methyl ester carboxylesterase
MTEPTAAHDAPDPAEPLALQAPALDQGTDLSGETPVDLIRLEADSEVRPEATEPEPEQVLAPLPAHLNELDNELDNELGIGGTVHQYAWQWREHNIRITYEVLGEGPPILLLPAFSTVSSRSEMRGLAESLADRYQVYALDWVGFGESERPQVEYSPKIYHALLRTFVRDTFTDPVVVIAAGHSAGYVMEMVQDEPQPWKWVVLTAPTWRGPLPTAMGEERRKAYGWLQRMVNTPVLGQLLYWLNSSRGFLKFMYRRHVFADADRITRGLMRLKGQTARQKNARFAAAAFVTGALDPVRDVERVQAYFQQRRVPVLLVIGEGMPPKSRQVVELVAHFGGGVQVLRMPGSLGLHEEYPKTLAKGIRPFLDKYLSTK